MGKKRERQHRTTEMYIMITDYYKQLYTIYINQERKKIPKNQKLPSLKYEPRTMKQQVFLDQL